MLEEIAYLLIKTTENRKVKWTEQGPLSPWLDRRLLHGENCPKKVHIGTGHLHGGDDDSPYLVDGVYYCGRCHTAL